MQFSMSSRLSGKQGKRGKEEKEENEENPILWFINIITVNQWGGGGGGGARSLQLLYLMAYQLYPRYLLYDLLSWTTLLREAIGNSCLIHRYHEANSNLRYHLLLYTFLPWQQRHVLITLQFEVVGISYLVPRSN